MDPALLISQVRALYPDLTEDVVSDAFLTAWMGWAKAQAGTDFKADQALATSLLLAHAAYKWLFSKDAGGIGGNVTSISTGQISASFATNGFSVGGDNDYASTIAGSAYLQLRASKARIVAPRIYI